MKTLFKLKQRAGFTLIEVITTIFIMSLLMILVLPNVHRIRQFAERKQSEAFSHHVQNQIDLFKGQYPGYEVTLPNLLEHGFMSKAQVDQFGREKLTLHGDQVKRPD
ncbi:competence type IV pilus major pilin ComGC [Weissella viridescens]|nr:prepilin-type N-terminal cleavage/methylation domain-containing protein [Weissella viridescens]